MPRLARATGIIALTLIPFTLAPMAAEKSSEAIVPVGSPSQQSVTISAEVMSLADALKAVSADSGIEVATRKLAPELLARKIEFSRGAAPFVQRLSEISAVANLSFEMPPHELVPTPSSGDLIGHTVVGPTLLVLRDIPAGSGSKVYLQLTAYFNPWEVGHDADTPSISDAILHAPGVAPVAVSLDRAPARRDRAVWTIMPKEGIASGIVWPNSVDGTLSVDIRSSLYRLTLPIGQSSAVSKDGLSVRSKGVAEASPTDRSETFELSWSSGLAPDDELKLSAMNDEAMKGLQPSVDALRWFQQKMLHARRFTVADVNIIASGGAVGRPKAYVCSSQGLSRLAVEVHDSREALANAHVEIVVGVIHSERFQFSIPVK